MGNAFGHMKRLTHVRQYLFPSELGITEWCPGAHPWIFWMARWISRPVRLLDLCSLTEHACTAQFQQSVLIDGKTYRWIMSLTVVLIPGWGCGCCAMDVECHPMKGLRQEWSQYRPRCISKHATSALGTSIFLSHRSDYNRSYSFICLSVSCETINAE